jgi:hypothetical protein
MDVTENRELAQDADPRLWSRPEGFLSEAYQAHGRRFASQPAETRDSVEIEAGRLGLLLAKPEVTWHAVFVLPEAVAVGPENEIHAIRPDLRTQRAGTWMDRLRGLGLRATLRQHFLRLEQSSDRSVATGAKLIRHATAVSIIQQVGEFPGEPHPPVTQETSEPEGEGPNGRHGVEQENSGRTVEGLPAPPWGWLLPVASEGDATQFFVPEWMAFDVQDRLLVEAPAQAESYLGLLQDSLAALRAAISLAPYMVVDEAYQIKRAGLLRQLGDQGRALTRYQTRQIVAVLHGRTAAGQLNRGLKVSLPYYDDQTLRLMLRTFDIIPAGRIMYVPALGVRAVQDEQAKVAQDTRLSSATRDHLLEELEMLKRAFCGPAADPGPA